MLSSYSQCFCLCLNYIQVTAFQELNFHALTLRQCIFPYCSMHFWNSQLWHHSQNQKSKMKSWNLSWDQSTSKGIYRSCWFAPEIAWLSCSTACSSVQQNHELVVNTFYSNNLKHPYTVSNWVVWYCWSNQSSMSNKNNNPFLLWSITTRFYPSCSRITLSNILVLDFASSLSLWYWHGWWHH